MRLAASLTDDEAETIIRTHPPKEAWAMLKRFILNDAQKLVGDDGGRMPDSSQLGGTR